MKTNLLTLVVTLTVGIILAGSLLMPVISDATDHTETLSNAYEGNYIFTLGNDAPVTLEYAEGVYKINNETVTPFNASYSTVTSDGLVIRWSSGSPGFFANGSQNIGTVSAFSLTADNGSITGSYTQNETTVTDFSWSYTYIFYQDASGKYVMTGGTSPAAPIYLLKDSVVYCTGYNTSLGSGAARWFEFTGSIKDGFTFSYGSEEITDVTVNATRLTDYEEEIYEVTNFQIPISESLTITINRFVAPLEFELTKVHNPAADTLLGAIPVLVIVALLIVAVGVVARRND